MHSTGISSLRDTERLRGVNQGLVFQHSEFLTMTLHRSFPALTDCLGNVVVGL